MTQMAFKNKFNHKFNINSEHSLMFLNTTTLLTDLWLSKQASQKSEIRGKTSKLYATSHYYTKLIGQMLMRMTRLWSQLAWWSLMVRMGTEPDN